MGLKDQKEFGAFENEAETETETTTTTQEQTMTTKPAATTTKTDAGAAAAMAIAKAATTGLAVAKPATKLVLAFSDKNAVFDVSTVEGLALALPRIKGEQGSLFQNDVELGAELQFEIVSVSPRWVLGTGEDDKEAKDFFRVSYDNHSISGHNVTVEDYLEELKAQGFSKANKSPYLDIFGFVTWSEKKGHVEPEARELSCLQCSKTSMGAFTAFATTRGLLESKGIAQPTDIIEVHAEKRVNGSNKYTNFSFSMPKAK